MNFDGHTLLITGGCRGIGRGLAEAFLQRGSTVIVASHRADELSAIAQALPGVHTLAMDVRDPDSITRGSALLLQQHPALDGVIHCAGIMRDDDVGAALDDAMLVDILHTNLLGPMRLNSALIAHFKRRPSATIINVSSMLGLVPLASSAIYSASKAALHSYTLSLRYRLRDTGITVRELAPPYVQTGLMAINLRDPRAMPLPQFLAETLEALAGDEPEVLVPSARQRRDALRHDEVAATAAFNDRMAATAPPGDAP